MIVSKCSRCGEVHPRPRRDRNDGNYYCGCGGTVEPFSICPICDAAISLCTAETFGYPFSSTEHLCPSCYEENRDELEAIDALPFYEAEAARRNWLYATV